jgi:uncharacterized membrane protein
LGSSKCYGVAWKIQMDFLNGSGTPKWREMVEK